MDFPSFIPGANFLYGTSATQADTLEFGIEKVDRFHFATTFSNKDPPAIFLRPMIWDRGLLAVVVFGSLVFSRPFRHTGTDTPYAVIGLPQASLSVV
jgi:hypothetical protein